MPHWIGRSIAGSGVASATVGRLDHEPEGRDPIYVSQNFGVLRKVVPTLVRPYLLDTWPVLIHLATTCLEQLSMSRKRRPTPALSDSVLLPPDGW
jgi:hypothetical protein